MLILIFSIKVFAVPTLSKNPISINADQIDFSDNNIISAHGNVEIIQNGSTLTASRVTYNKAKDQVIAHDNVKLVDEDNIIFADSLELRDEFKKGVIDNFLLKQKKGATYKAKYVIKKSEYKYLLKRAFYTTCPICNNKEPLWSITAREAELDEKQEGIKYKNASFRVYGLPIIFTPYFYHLTQGAKQKRKSGFLTPSYGTDSYLGVSVRVPYYYNIAPEKDFTFAPIITSNRGIVFTSEYRQLTEEGRYNVSGSITDSNVNTKNSFAPDVRYFFKTDGIFHYTDRWDTSFDINYTSDKTYLKNYKFGNQDSLISHTSLNYDNDRDYFTSQFVYFQNLRENQHTNGNPILLPYIYSHLETSPNDDSGSFFSLDYSVLNLKKYNDIYTNRYSTKVAWHKPFIFDSGQLLNIEASTRGDFYHYYNRQNDPTYIKSHVGRIIPEFYAETIYPLYKDLEKGSLIIQPTTSLSLIPSSNYNDNIKNEDSRSTELTEVNLFDLSRIHGIDLVEQASRVNYGIVSNYYTGYDIDFDALFGQSYRFKELKPAVLGSNLELDKFSSYIGKIAANAGTRYMIEYKFKLSKNNFSFLSSEVAFEANYDHFFLRTEYVSFNDIGIINVLRNRKELYNKIGFRNKEWSLSFNIRQNLSKKIENSYIANRNGIIQAGSELLYKGDCIGVSTTINKDFTSMPGKKEALTWTFNVLFNVE
jgi:LPS-assembly protein